MINLIEIIVYLSLTVFIGYVFYLMIKNENNEEMKDLTVLEIGDTESPMIGTINNVTTCSTGELLFKERLNDALREHFDIYDISVPKVEIMPIMESKVPYMDFKLQIEQFEVEIRVLETWNY